MIEHMEKSGKIEKAAMGNSTLPTVSDKLNIMASIHNRKLISSLARDLKEKDSEIQELRQTVTSLENKINELSKYGEVIALTYCLAKLGIWGLGGHLNIQREAGLNNDIFMRLGKYTDDDLVSEM